MMFRLLCPKYSFLLILFLLAFISCLLVLNLLNGNPNSNHDATRLARRNPTGPEYELQFLDFTEGQFGYLGNTNNSHSTIKEIDSKQISLLTRIEDLKRIKLSLSNELRLIEKEKVKLLKDKASLARKNDKLVAQINKSKFQLKQLELDISANRRQKFEQNCDTSQVAPIIFNPMSSIDIDQLSIESFQKEPTHFHHQLTHLNTNYTTKYSFDLSLCPLTREFKFYLLEQNSSSSDTPAQGHRFKIDTTLVKDILKSHRQHTEYIDEACLLISLYNDPDTKLDLNPAKNNLVINLLDNGGDINDNAVIASCSVRGSDLLLPCVWRSPDEYASIIGSVPPQSPIERKYLASYFGEGSTDSYELNRLEKVLQSIHRNSIDDLFLFVYRCGPETDSQCYEEKEKIIELSIFLIILPSETDNNTSEQVYLALSRGAIPVIIGREKTRLPFDKVIDWRRATIMVHTARLPELHFILRSMIPSDLYQLKYHGRRIFENYLATTKQILETTVGILSLEFFNYPPPPVQNVKTIRHYMDDNMLVDVNCTAAVCIESKTDSLDSLLSNEIYGPREKPFMSHSYRRNFSLTLSSTYDLWNNPMYSALQLFPSYPNDPSPPSEYKFFDTDQGYRPIGDGLGGSGIEFSRALGGDRPNEQFTIVLLTYERNSLLMRTLERLKGLSYLNKIIVVWNGVTHKPPVNLVWPDVGVPIIVVKVDKNSLNNRFLPYDAIETDAILSLDDDSPLRPDEIVFAFRVWRQSRDRIVGFPGRYHAWDRGQSTWMYNSNHSCELSMVLTGGAFFHKYYSYIYTYDMPEVIRSIVDKFMNCEDIAMNFLVAHLTRKPPIKVTSRWTFHCVGCQNSLSEDDSHFRERHECLNTFASIYGYMPLLSTQHRSDSVLFKTRLPRGKQKCFKFV